MLALHLPRRGILANPTPAQREANSNVARTLDFSSKSFRQISERERRRGNEDPGALFPDVLVVIRALKDLRADRRDALRAVPRDDWEERAKVSAPFEERAKKLRAEKNVLLLDNLVEVSRMVTSEILDGTFSWGLAPGPIIRTKPTYRIDRSKPDVYFAAKQMESSIRRSYFGVSSSRNKLVSQLSTALDNKMPKTVVKTDISAFFESVPHAGIWSMWQSSSSLGTLTSAFLKQFLDEQAILVGAEQGLPRGVGMSSQLAEAYLQGLDRRVRAAPQVSFYARYVDDIVIVVSGGSEDRAKALLADVKSTLSDLSLKLNEGKTEILKAGDSGSIVGSFEFLGYKFSNPGGKVQATFSSAKVAKYKKRIDDVLAGWIAHKSKTSGHEGLLLDRWRFMTGNARLANNKKDALTGVYFSNPHLTEMSVLTGLDAYAVHKVNSTMIPEPLKSRMLGLKFVDGFRSRVVYRFSQNELSRIAAVWKDA